MGARHLFVGVVLGDGEAGEGELLGGERGLGLGLEGFMRLKRLSGLDAI